MSDDTLDTTGAVQDYLKGGDFLGGPDLAAQARVSMSSAVGSNPVMEAELRKVAERTGVPISSARAMPEEVKRRAAMADLDFEDMAQRLPSTMAFLAKQENAQIAHDDVENMGLLESTVNSFKRGWQGLKQLGPTLTLANQAGALANIDAIDKQLASGKKPEEIASSAMGPLANMYAFMTAEERAAFRQNVVPTMPSTISTAAAKFGELQSKKEAIPAKPVAQEFAGAKTWGEALSALGRNPLDILATIGPESLVQSAPGMLAAIPASIVGGPAGGAAVLGANSFAVDYAATVQSVLQESGVNLKDPAAVQKAMQNPAILAKALDQASRHAGVVGAVDAVSGGLASKALLPTSVLAKTPVARAVADIGVQTAAQGALGAAGEAGGQINAGQEIQPGQILAEAVGEVVSTPAEVASMSAGRMREAAAQRAQLRQRVIESTQSAQSLQALVQTAAKSKLMERDPQALADFVQKVADDGKAPSEVFVDVKAFTEALAQGGVTLDQAVAAMPSIANQLVEAQAAGGDIAIPLGEFTAGTAGSKIGDALMQHVRTAPDALSQAEAAELTKGSAKQLQADAERILAEQGVESETATSATAVRANVFDQLQAAARFTPDVNAAYADMVRDFYVVQAQRLGLTPEAMLTKYPLNIKAEGTFASALDQADFKIESTGSRSGQTDHTLSLFDNGQELGAVDYSVYAGTPAIQMIRVPERQRRKGYGRRLVQRLQAEFPETEIDWGVLTDDGAALRKSLQFREVPIVEMQEKQAQLQAALAERAALEARAERGENSAEADLDRWNELHDQVDALTAEFDGQRAVKRLIETDSFSQNKSGARGQFSPSTSTITLLAKADLSTFLHETGHFYLEVLADMASQPDAPAEVAADMAKVLEWFGVPDLAAWRGMTLDEQRPHHETFARGFESYLFEGKAPSTGLAPLFQRFAAWMKNVYKSIVALNVEINPEIRGVFDRLLASEQQITEAEAARGYAPLFKDAADAGMTETEWADYQALGAEATEDATIDLARRSLRDMRWLSNARSRVLKELQKDAKAKRDAIQAEVAAEVAQTRVYAAENFLRKGVLERPGMTNAERKAVDSIAGMNTKLDLGALKDMYGEGPAAPWRYLPTGKNGMATTKDGIHPDIAADILGYDSGDALVRDVLAAEPQAEVIEGMTDQRMLERYGELSDEDAIQRATDAAMHNEVRARFVATELSALNRALGKPRVLMAAAKQFAAQIIGRKPIKDIKPNRYAAAAAKAAKEAERGKDVIEKATAKRNQLLNHYAHREALDAQTEIGKIRAFFRKVADTPDDKVGKTRDMDVVNAARATLAAYGIGRRGEAAAEYLTKVAAYDPEMHDVLKGSVDAALASAKPLDELTFDELRALRDEIDSLWHLAKRSRQMEVDGDMLDREDVQDALKARMQEVGIPAHIAGEGSAVTPAEARLAKLKTYLASARRTEGWVEAMDGATGGSFRRFIWQPVKEAADAYRADRARLMKHYRDLLAAIAPSMRKRVIDAPELGYTFGKDTGGVGLNEILHAILHTGNASNKKKLLLGRKWATESADGTLDTSRWDAFIRRMAAEGVLTKDHFDFVQGVWDMLETTKPLAQKTHRDVFGKYFAEITAEEVDTPFGRYRGGYVPAQADPRVVSDAKTRALMEDENASMAFAFPATNRGFTKGRVEYNRPLMLDLATLTQHIDKVLLFGHMERPIRDVRRVLTSKGVAYAVNRIDPAAFDAIISPWLNRAARQQVTTPSPGHWQSWRLWSTLRNRAGMAAMFGNVVNAAQQITGFSIAAVKVRPKYLLGAMAHYVTNPRQLAQDVAEASPYMEGRISNEIAAMNDAIKDILIDPGMYEKTQQWTMRHAYFLQSAVDNVMSPIIWIAARNQALEQGQDEREAGRFADATVRTTQGSTLPEDISNWEAGSSFSRMFSQFAGYFNMQANLLGTEFQTIARDMGLRKGAGRGLYVLTLAFLVPAWMGELIVQAARGGPDDEDKDGEYLDDWLTAVFGMSTLRGLTAMVPIFGQGLNAIGNATNSKPYDDRLATSPAISMIESAVKAPTSVYSAMFADGDKSRAVKDVASLISLTTGIPANIAARPLSYLADVAEGDVQPADGADMARGLVTGRASPESKR